jgi:hypothetical protein
MPILTEDMKRIVREQSLGFVAERPWTKPTVVVPFSFATRDSRMQADPLAGCSKRPSGEPECEQVLQPVTDRVGRQVGAAAGHGVENVSRVG